MTIQNNVITINNRPLTPEEKELIKRYIKDMRNRDACYRSTGMDERTQRRIMWRGWASQEQIDVLLKYCEEVRKYEGGKE